MPPFIEVPLIAFLSWLSGFLMADGLKKVFTDCGGMVIPPYNV